jgi:hypothetical protein
MSITIRPSSDVILQRARLARASQPSNSLDKLILNIALGARCCFAGSDLLVESLSSPGKIYTVNAAGCDCAARRICWHQQLYALLSDPPGDNPMGDDEGDSLPSRAMLGARIAIARRAHPFDLLTAMDRPAPPAQSIAARAGEMIHARGLAGALAVALMDSLSRDIPYQDILSQVYTELAMAAVE